MPRMLPFLLSSLLLACSGSGVTPSFDATSDDASDDSAAADSAASDGDTAALDTSLPDAKDDATKDDGAPVDTGPAPDSAKSDAGFDATGTFECGAERCGATFQFCQIDAAPGTGRHCVPLPASCFAFPACPCVTTKTCGSEAKGTCTDVSGAITVQCK